MLVIAFLLALLAVPSLSDNELNVVIFMLSESSTSAIPAYMSDGHPLKQNSGYCGNLKALEQESIVFDRAYTNIALSSPSRLSFLSSLHPRRQIRVMNSGDASKSPAFDNDREVVFTQFVTARLNKFQSIGGGRLFWETQDTLKYGGLSLVVTPALPTQDASFCVADAAAGLPDICNVLSEKGLVDSDLSTKSISALRSSVRSVLSGAIKNFLMVIGYYRTFGDRSQPAWAKAQVDAQASAIDASIAANFNRFYGKHPMDRITNVNNPDTTLNSADVSSQKRGYFSTMQWVDFNIGVILDELKGLKMMDSTVIIVTGDTGVNLGEFNSVGTSGVFEHTTRIPLMVRHPRLTWSKGTRSGAQVELTDVSSTVYDLLEVEKPDTTSGSGKLPLHGITFHGLLILGPSFYKMTMRHAAFTEIARCTPTSDPFRGVGDGQEYTGAFTSCEEQSNPIRVDMIGISMRTNLWRYTEWRRTNGDGVVYWESSDLWGRELYSHEADRGLVGMHANEFELENLAPCASCKVIPFPRKNRRLRGQEERELEEFFQDAANDGMWEPPDLPSNKDLADTIRYLSLTMRVVSTGGTVCSNHGRVNADTGACVECDVGWRGNQCETPIFNEINTVNPTPTLRPTFAPTQANTARPPQGAPTIPPGAPTPLPSTRPPTLSRAPTPGTTIDGGDPRGDVTCSDFTTERSCGARQSRCMWTGTKCRVRTPAPTGPPTWPTKTPTAFPTRAGQTLSPIGSSEITKPPVMRFRGRCSDLSDRPFQCDKINGCKWKGKDVGCIVPLPTACECSQFLDPVMVRIGEKNMFFRNKCHASCRGFGKFIVDFSKGGGVIDAEKPDPTLELGPGSRMENFDLHIVVDASAISAFSVFDSECRKERGRSCWELIAGFFRELEETIVGFIDKGFSGNFPDAVKYLFGFRISIHAYSCEKKEPVTVTIMSRLNGDMQDIEKAFDYLSKSVVPSGGRCPQGALSRISAMYAGEATRNSAVVLLMNGYLHPPDSYKQPASTTIGLRMKKIQTFVVLTSKRFRDPGLDKEDVELQKFQAYNIAGSNARVFSSGNNAWIGLSSQKFVKAVGGAILYYMQMTIEPEIEQTPPEFNDLASQFGTVEYTSSDNESSGVIAGSVLSVIGIVVIAVVGYVHRERVKAVTRVQRESLVAAAEGLRDRWNQMRQGKRVDENQEEIVVSVASTVAAEGSNVSNTAPASPMKTARRRSSIHAEEKDKALSIHPSLLQYDMA